jgi:hypothetical protein
MDKYTLFFPSDIDLSDKVKDTVLWKAKYKLHDESYVPVSFIDKINSANDPSLPMTHWKHWMKDFGLGILYDFSYLKEYAYFVDDIPVFTVTLRALDLNTEHKEVIVRSNLAHKILDEMNFKTTGSTHPEKFQNKLTDCIDLSDDDLIQEDEIIDVLFELENLCIYCLNYESFIEWKGIS